MLLNAGRAEWLFKALLSLFLLPFVLLIYSAVSLCIYISFFMSSTTSTNLIDLSQILPRHSSQRGFGGKTGSLTHSIRDVASHPWFIPCPEWVVLLTSRVVLSRSVLPWFSVHLFFSSPGFMFLPSWFVFLISSATQFISGRSGSWPNSEVHKKAGMLSFSLQI